MLLALTLVSLAQPRFLCGGDVSEIPEVEAAGGKYVWRGRVMDPFALFRKAGWNFVRFRVWNDPKDGLCDEAATLKLAKRASAEGLAISIDLHYADWWADPGHQPTPKAWMGLAYPDLTKAVYGFTKKLVEDLISQGTPPVMVQVGNEITAGMLWPMGKVTGDDPHQWGNLAGLVAAGVHGVKDGAGGIHIRTMIHLDRGGDNKGARWWFDHLQKENVQFDLIGLSFYPFWHGSLQALSDNLKDLSQRYGKDVYVVETAYPWTVADPAKQDGAVYDGRTKLSEGYKASSSGQKLFLKKLKRIIRDVPDGRGRGLLYWAPAWISTTSKKTPWANLATFDYDGKALPATDELGAK